MRVEEAVQLYLDHRRPRVAARSFNVYKGWIDRWLKWRSKRNHSPLLNDVSLIELQSYLDTMERQGLAPSSRDATWRVFKAMWRLLNRRGLLTPEQQTFFGEDGLAPIPVPEEVRPTYDPADIEKLIAACASYNPEQESRNRAIIWLLAQTGARVSEICSLKDEKCELWARRGVIVGKGNRQRWLFWDDEAAAQIDIYLTHRRGLRGGSLLRDLDEGEALTDNAVRLVLKRAAKRAGVQLVPRAPLHSFRRTFAHEALDAGLADLDLQQLLGHRSIVSTQRYTRRDPARLSKVYQRIAKKRRGKV